MVIALLAIYFLAVNCQDDGKYVGLPIGAIKDPKIGFDAEVSIADEHTLVLDKFTHNPPKEGCQTLMLGPARPEDAARQIGPGILLPYTQFNFAWEETMLMKRTRRKRESSLDDIPIFKGPTGRKSRLIPSLPAAGTRKPFTRTTRKPITTTTFDENASYEVIEYVDDEEETEVKEESRGGTHSVQTHVQDGETHIVEEVEYTETVAAHVPTTTALTTPATTIETTLAEELSTEGIVDFPTLMTEAPADAPTKAPTTKPPMIIFDIQSKHKFKESKKRNGDKQKKPTTSAPSTTTETTEEPTVTEIASTTGASDPDAPTTTSPLVSFLLPPASLDRAAFLLTNGASITDYKWLGLWDQCEKKSTPYIWLAGLDPPREEDIGNMTTTKRGRGYRVTTGIAKILNCNTILLQDVHFQPRKAHERVYFYVGTGDPTEKTRVQSRAHVVGFGRSDPLERLAGDDVMIRLPAGARTFDIDYLSIFKETTKETLAHISIPSLLVPPCSD